MPTPLPRLRLDLEFMPSPVPDRPGLYIRDPYRYTDAAVIVPPLLAEGLAFFDGQQTDLDLQAHLMRRAGELVPAEVVQRMVDALAQQGFLHTEQYDRMRESKHRAFREAALRTPVHAGVAYPKEAAGLREQLDKYDQGVDGLGSRAPRNGKLVGLAAPHVSPEGGWRSYVAAYRTLTPDLAGRTFILLGTSHYGSPERFGITRKPFVTPLGTLEADLDLIQQLADRGGDAVQLEDYCHSIEHSIEFQCVFLQHRLDRDAKIVPILCGPLAESLVTGRAPETDESVRRFFETLGEIGEQYGDRLFWILGIDLAHIGRRYGDRFAARAGQDQMVDVRRRDEERLEQICSSDSGAFFDLVRPNQDELRWCGYSPVYTFLRARPAARGRVLHYEQWNIDEMSVVSFAGMEFTAA